MTAAVRVAASTWFGHSTTNPTLTVAANAGEIIVLKVTLSASSAQMTAHPAGYTLLNTITNTSNDSGFLYWRTATGTAGDNVSFTTATAVDLTIMALACSGVDAVDASASNISPTTVTMAAPSVIATRDGDLLVSFFSINGNASGVPAGAPTGMTLAASETSHGLPRLYAYKEVVATGSTGTRTITSSNFTTGRDHAASIVLRSSPDAPIRLWSGVAWVLKPLLRWDGAAWRTVASSDLRRWDGTAWVNPS